MPPLPPPGARLPAHRPPYPFFCFSISSGCASVWSPRLCRLGNVPDTEGGSTVGEGDEDIGYRTRRAEVYSLRALPPWQLARTCMVTFIGLTLLSNISCHYLFGVTWFRYAAYWDACACSPFHSTNTALVFVCHRIFGTSTFAQFRVGEECAQLCDHGLPRMFWTIELM